MAKKLFNLSPYHFMEVIGKGFDFNYIYLLSLVDEGYEISSFKNSKIEAIIQSLVRKELITDNHKITQTGKDLLEFCNSSKRLQLNKLSENKEDFEKWWSEYPASNNFSYNGKLFEGSQSKRIQKDDCKILFNKLINSGYKPEDIIGATKYHIELTKKLSFTKKDNQLSYVYNSARYLREKSFEAYIEIYKQKVVKPEEKSNLDTVI